MPAPSATRRPPAAAAPSAAAAARWSALPPAPLDIAEAKERHQTLLGKLRARVEPAAAAADALQTFRAASSAFVKSGRDGGGGGGGGDEEQVGATEYMQTFLVLFGKQGAAPLLLELAALLPDTRSQRTLCAALQAHWGLPPTTGSASTAAAAAAPAAAAAASSRAPATAGANGGAQWGGRGASPAAPSAAPPAAKPKLTLPPPYPRHSQRQPLYPPLSPAPTP